MNASQSVVYISRDMMMQFFEVSDLFIPEWHHFLPTSFLDESFYLRYIHVSGSLFTSRTNNSFLYGEKHISVMKYVPYIARRNALSFNLATRIMLHRESLACDIYLNIQHFYSKPDLEKDNSSKYIRIIVSSILNPF